MEPYESGGKRTREEETPSAIWTKAEGGGSVFSPCRETRGTEGGGFGRRSQRQAEYVRVEPFRQCGHWHVSYAPRAGI